RQERVFQLLKAHEVPRPGDPDGRAVVPVAPGDVVDPVYQRDARVIRVLEPAHLRVVAVKLDGLRLECELQAVRAAADVQMRDAVHSLRAEHANEPALPWDDRAVVDSGDP